MKGELTNMKCIYASKIYIASSRKDKIKAALVNAANAKLVQQLAESLDEEYRQKDLIDPDRESEAPKEGEQGSSEGGSASPSGGGGGSLGSLSSGMDMSSFDPESDLVEYPEGEEGEATDSEGEVDEEETVEDEEVKESVQITACTLDSSQLNVLKDSLNLVDKLSGVTRVVVKEDELWIFYADNVNLNNIMTDVIENLAQPYPYLEFNRLARSDNAIVFELTSSVSSESI